MSKRVNQLVEEFEEAVRKKTHASSPPPHGPHDKEIAEILYVNTKQALIARIKHLEKVVALLSRAAH